jgi:signal transduction histidine kinase/CheY-like chemotaxis protein
MNVVTQFSASPEYNPDPRYQAMFAGAAMGLGICRLDGRIMEANPAFSKILGYSEEELTGSRAGDFIGKVRAERRGEIGREIYPGSFAPDEQALGELLRGERDSFETEKCYRRKDGSEVWGHLTVSLGRNTRREPAFLIAMLTDASVPRRMAEHLCEVEKMEIIGRLAGGIAHDFNNLLTGILLYCDLMTTGLEKSEEERRRLDSGGFENHGLKNHGWDTGELWQHVEEVRKAGEQGAALTKQLMAIARKQAAEPHLVAINEIVTSSEDLLRRLIGKQIELVVTLDTGAGLVMADPAQLRQVLLNLALNARDAVAQGGKIRLITRATELPGDTPPGGLRSAVSLAVKDSGCGMDAETRARLFEPFFTTKKPGEGTGLGLATVARIVSEAGGAIKVESEPGHGTCIEVFFPAIITSAQTTSGPVSSPALFVHQAGLRDGLSFTGELLREIGSKTVLLVDDHPAARKSIERILLVAGYRVLTAPGGKQALQLFTEHAAAVDLLIAECMMPEMKGQELAETLRQQKPGLKVLLVSGFLDVPIDPAVTTLNVIHKPFSGKTLIERVVEVMVSP